MLSWAHSHSDHNHLAWSHVDQRETCNTNMHEVLANAQATLLCSIMSRLQWIYSIFIFSISFPLDSKDAESPVYLSCWRDEREGKGPVQTHEARTARPREKKQV